MTIEQTIAALAERGITVRTVCGMLEYRPAHKMTNPIKAAMLAHKPALLVLFGPGPLRVFRKPPPR